MQEEDRNRLLDVVKRMEEAGEDRETIQRAVDLFKRGLKKKEKISLQNKMPLAEENLEIPYRNSLLAHALNWLRKKFKRTAMLTK